MKRFILRHHWHHFTQTAEILVDDDNACLLRAYEWSVMCTPNGYKYVYRLVNGTHVFLHRMVNEEGKHTYHKNGNSLDNRRCNLTSKAPCYGPRFEKLCRLLGAVSYPDLEPAV